MPAGPGWLTLGMKVNLVLGAGGARGFAHIGVIQEFFGRDRDTATQIMLKIHLDGKAVCGVYSKDVAATKVDQVMDAAAKAGHPLQCVSEPVE